MRRPRGERVAGGLDEAEHRARAAVGAQGPLQRVDRHFAGAERGRQADVVDEARRGACSRAAAGRAEADLARCARTRAGRSESRRRRCPTGIWPAVVGEDAAVGLEESSCQGALGTMNWLASWSARLPSPMSSRRRGAGRPRRGCGGVSAQRGMRGVLAPGRALAGGVDRLREECREDGVVAAAEDRRGGFEGGVDAGLGVEGEATQPHMLRSRPVGERPDCRELLRCALPGPVAVAVRNEDPSPDRHAEPVGGADDPQRVVPLRLTRRDRAEVPAVAEVEVEGDLVAAQDPPQVRGVAMRVAAVPVRAWVVQSVPGTASPAQKPTVVGPCGESGVGEPTAAVPRAAAAGATSSARAATAASVARVPTRWMGTIIPCARTWTARLSAARASMAGPSGAARRADRRHRLVYLLQSDHQRKEVVLT